MRKKRMSEEMTKLKEGHSQKLNATEAKVQRVTEELEEKKLCQRKL